MLGERRSIHVRGDECVGVLCFLDGDAANKGRNFAWNFVEPAKHDVLAAGFRSGALQHIAQARSGEAGGSHRTFAPLNAGNLGTMKAASVPGALESIDD